jgi:Zn-dependent oligopeptidase
VTAPATTGDFVGLAVYEWIAFDRSEVYSMDMFVTRFKKGGKLLDEASGMDYRKKILAVGSSRDAMDSLVDFLGRFPNTEAFLASKGL